MASGVGRYHHPMRRTVRPDCAVASFGHAHVVRLWRPKRRRRAPVDGVDGRWKAILRAATAERQAEAWAQGVMPDPFRLLVAVPQQDDIHCRHHAGRRRPKARPARAHRRSRAIPPPVARTEERAAPPAWSARGGETPLAWARIGARDACPKEKTEPKRTGARAGTGRSILRRRRTAPAERSSRVPRTEPHAQVRLRARFGRKQPLAQTHPRLRVRNRDAPRSLLRGVGAARRRGRPAPRRYGAHAPVRGGSPFPLRGERPGVGSGRPRTRGTPTPRTGMAARSRTGAPRSGRGGGGSAQPPAFAVGRFRKGRMP